MWTPYVLRSIKRIKRKNPINFKVTINQNQKLKTTTTKSSKKNNILEFSHIEQTETKPSTAKATTATEIIEITWIK